MDEIGGLRMFVNSRTRNRGTVETQQGTALNRGWKFATIAVLLSGGLAACSYDGPSPQPVPSEIGTPTGTARAAGADVGIRSALGPVVSDSFGNADFYTTLAGDTTEMVAHSFRLSDAKLAEFNDLDHEGTLATGIRLRLIPAPGPIIGAKGTAVVDAKGIPISYVVAPNDTIGGITYRFGLTDEQLAEANKVAITYEKGGVYFLLAGKHLRLQKNPVDSRSGTGASVNNSFGKTIFYTTVDGDSLDSLGYIFRCSTAQLLQYNPSLATDRHIPAGTRVRLIPGELKIDGARGSFTADAAGIPLTYTTAPGDTEIQVALRFGVTDLRSANRPLTGGAGAWYDLAPSLDEFAPGQTISLDLNKPINK
ncbi:LysM domain-containing protein [Arthrobacter oryzae]|uniref:LysM domain-containing protein n=1 Tax=Arthrobacter oryzae TaxID=409290 RepID=A0A495FLU5_9MICC|nr:LysM domain-containing protein [Arthrobacter oryzae]